MSADVLPRKALDSSLESQMSYWRLFLTVVGVVFGGIFLYNMLFKPVARPPVAEAAIVVTATATATPVGALLPVIAEQPRQVEVTRIVEVPVIVTAAPRAPEIIRVPVEVVGPERVVEVVVTATPTPAPALGPGTIRICTWAAGVREVYVDGSGMVPGSCVERVVGVGASYIQVQINR